MFTHASSLIWYKIYSSWLGQVASKLWKRWEFHLHLFRKRKLKQFLLLRFPKSLRWVVVWNVFRLLVRFWLSSSVIFLTKTQKELICYVFAYSFFGIVCTQAHVYILIFYVCRKGLKIKSMIKLIFHICLHFMRVYSWCSCYFFIDFQAIQFQYSINMRNVRII